MDLDERLDLSAQPTTTRSEALRADILEMVTSTEEKQRARRRKLGLTSGVLASVLTAGGGITVAAANGAFPALYNWMASEWRRHESAPHDAREIRMWLFGIARNVLSNHRRSGRRRVALADKLRGHLQQPVTPSDEDAVAVRDAVERLDPERRELVKLIHWEGFTVKEAATILGLNPSTARGWYASAKQELRTALCPAERAGI